MTDLFCCELSAIHSNGSQPSNWPLNWAPLDLNPTKNYHRKDDWIYLFWLQEQQRKQIIVREPLKIEIFFFFFLFRKNRKSLSDRNFESGTCQVLPLVNWLWFLWRDRDEMRWGEMGTDETRRDEEMRKLGTDPIWRTGSDCIF